MVLRAEPSLDPERKYFFICLIISVEVISNTTFGTAVLEAPCRLKDVCCKSLSMPFMLVNILCVLKL